MIIAYDLGTGGIKASLFDTEGNSLCDIFKQYEVTYRGSDFHEQRPDEWYDGMCKTTAMLLEKTGVKPSEVLGISMSGHSIGAVPVDAQGNLLREYVPIWSDSRSKSQREKFFSTISYEEWYNKTGNGFPAECYSIFKIMWYMENENEMYQKTYKIIGSKDYCNLKMTGKICSDYSYASGSGVFDLLKNDYDFDYIRASGVREDIMPELVNSHEVIGNLTAQAASELGLTTNAKVVAGGVDNSCMSLGARGFKDGRAYISLGSSSWIAITSGTPLLDVTSRPYVFTHVVPGMYVSSTSIFSAGSSFRWVRDNVFADLLEQEKQCIIKDAYVRLNELAAKAPIGANYLQFNPSLSGGGMLEKTANMVGGYVGLTLSHSREDMVRSAMEGIVYNLKYALIVLQNCGIDIDELLMVGGGAKSPFWRQMFADIFEKPMIKTTIDQNAASLGAAALAAYGLGMWSDYSIIDNIHQLQSREQPQNSNEYKEHYELSRKIADYMADSGDLIHLLKNK